MTRKQSKNQWSGGIAAHPAPKYSECKIRWKNSRLDFFSIRTASSSFIIFQGPNYQLGVLLISVGAIEGHYEGKTLRKIHQRSLVLHDNAPAYRTLVRMERSTA